MTSSRFEKQEQSKVVINPNNKGQKATLSLEDIKTGKPISLELPIYVGSTGRRVIDVTHLHSEAGYFTYDPGFASTASCESKITFIDGQNGILLYRGYGIEDLVEHCDF